MKFQLVGHIGYDVGSCHDSRSVSVDEEFEAVTVEEAITKAKEIVQRYHERYKHQTDYGFSAELRTVTSVWKTYFVDERPARPVIPRKVTPAQPARPAVPAHFEEEKIT